jgi:biofilm PGA synthesis lipoprotein PgaB
MRLLIVNFALLILSASAQAGQTFVSFAYHDVRKEVHGDYDPDQYAISTHNLAAHFAWLKHHGYTPVSIDDLVAAANNERPLPDKAVLLTFDDGLKSAYTEVFPLLKIFNYPAVFSVVTDWMELPPGVTIDYGSEFRDNSDFISWADAREMHESGLVTIASHSADLHHGIVANPQKNQVPAAIARAYQDDDYEKHEEFTARITADLQRSMRAITDALGTPPTVMTWPYGKYTLNNLQLATKLGMSISMTLDPGINSLPDLSNIRRILVQENPGINAFSTDLLKPQAIGLVRAAHVDLDYIYSADPAKQNRNLDLLLDRIKELKISHVFLQAFADPDGNGSASELYFPNRHLPVRSDLYSRVAWQLATRSNVAVFAWMPLLAYESPDFNSEWRVVQDKTGEPNPAAIPRLSPFSPDARQIVREIYEDLAAYTPYRGVFFHDDARLNETEDASPDAMAAYRLAFGNDFNIASAKENPALLQEWSRLKTQALIDFSDEMAAVLRQKQPQLKTVRSISAPVVLDSSREIQFAQSYELSLSSYDYVALTAKPHADYSDNPSRQLEQLATAIARQTGGFNKTIFELQAVDWRTGMDIPAKDLFRQMRKLQASGVKHLAYYSDEFVEANPQLDQIRQGISLADYPFRLQ